MGKIKVSEARGARIKYLQDDPIPDLDASWQVDGETAYPGKRVEEFIKRQFRGKVGYVYRTSEKQDDGNYHLQFFATEEDYNTWAADKDVHSELLLGDVVLPEGGGGQMSASYYDGLYTNTSTTGYVTTDGTFKVEIRFTSQLHNPVNNTDEDTGNSGTLVIQRRSSDTESWQTVGKLSISSTPASETTTWQTIDLSKYLLDGSQNIRLQVVDDAAGVKTRYLVYNNVVKTNLGLTFATEWWKPVTDVIPLSYYLYGAVDKTLHIQISGEGGIRMLEYKIGNTVYADTPWTASVGDADTDAVKVLTHGVHKIEAWLTVGDSTATEHVQSQVFVKKDTADTKSYLVINGLLSKVANYTDAELFDYAVFTNNDAPIDVNVAATNSKGTANYGKNTIKNVAPGEKHAYNNMLEVDGETAKSVTAYLSFTDGGGSLIAGKVAIMVDNSVNFAPTAGADFVLNPKNRNNDETAAQSILNDKDGSTVGSTWTGFSMTSDGWGTDDKGVKCLKIPAGESVNIDYEAFTAFLGDKAHTDSLTVEFDLMVSHISDEDEPLIQMCSYNGQGVPVGLLLRGKTMVFATVGKTTLYHQDIHLEEGVRTHVALNIVYNLYNKGINYVKFFINGVCNRKFEYSEADTFVQYVDGKQTSQGIRLGGTGADLTVYGMRVYKKALGTRDVMQDSLSHFATAKEKRDFLSKNDILNDDGSISFSKTKAKYNTLCYTGSMPSYSDKADRAEGIVLEVHIKGDAKHSGTMNNLSAKGQGSSSKGYWKWNWQMKFNSDSKFVSEDGTVTIDKGYQLDDTVPVATKLVDKRNWASSMQSHKMGATSAYNDLWKEICGGNTITKTAGYEKCRVAVKEQKFMVFQRDTENDEPKFVGFGTFGSGKADKPTFWGDPKKFPGLLMIEGSDNGRPLTLCQVPWMDDEVTFDAKEEGWFYAGNISWDYDLGTIEDGKTEPNNVDVFKNAFTQVFLHSIAIEPHEGNLTTLKADTTLNKATQYWITEDEGTNKKFDLFRYDYITKDWVNASASKTNGVYDRLNINEQCGGVASGADWEAINKLFIAKRIEWARSDDGLKKYCEMDDTLFHKCIVKLFGLSDNLCKNIYPYADPGTLKIRWFSDDDDTMAKIDNVGDNTKTYHVEEQDSVANGRLKQGEGGWNGADNNFFNLLEAAFPSEMREMMKKILDTMAKMASKGGYGSTPWDFIQHYFFDISEYFPAVAFNEAGRVLYEEAAVAMKAGKYTNATDPLTQDLGNNLSTEKDWWKWRLIYMSSYCGYGAFANRATGSLFFRSTSTVNGGTRPEYKFKLKPAVWLYLSGFMGQQMVYGKGQTMPQRMIPGNEYELDMTGDENTDIGICGADYFKSFGNFGDKSLGAVFNLSGERLEEFVANKASGVMEFRPTSINVSDCPALKKFDIEGASTVGGTLDLTGCGKMEVFNAKSTALSGVAFPQSPLLSDVKLGKNIKTLNVSGPSLQTLTLEGYGDLQSVTFGNGLNPAFSVSNFLLGCMNGGAKIQMLSWRDGTFTDPTDDVINYFAGISSLDIHNIKLVYATRNLSFDSKSLLMATFGNIDDKTNNVYAEYTSYAISSISVVGSSYLTRTGGQYKMSVSATPASGNDFVAVKWSIDNTTNASIDQKGVVEVIKTGTASEAPHGTVTCEVTLKDGSKITGTHNVMFYDYEPKVGDYVFSDGSTSATQQNDSGLTAIGRCIWINPSDKTDRLMCSLGNISNGTQWGIWPDLNVKLTDHPGYPTADIPTLGNGSSGSVGDKVNGIPVGKYNTQLIIAHRNVVLKDSGVNLPVPEEQAAAGNDSVFSYLSNDLSNAAVKGNSLTAYYYPAASMCYAYEPAVRKNEKLDDRFKAGQWFLPICNAIVTMLNNKLIDTSIDYWSSQEGDGRNAWHVDSNGYVGSWGKNIQFAVRAVAAF